jgi:hypothetical protein
MACRTRLNHFVVHAETTGNNDAEPTGSRHSGEGERGDRACKPACGKGTIPVRRPRRPTVLPTFGRCERFMRDGFPESGRVYHNRLLFSRLTRAAPSMDALWGDQG